MCSEDPMGWSNTTDIAKIVNHPDRFLVYSRVSHGIGVPLFLGLLSCVFRMSRAYHLDDGRLVILDILCTPLLRFSYILAFLMESTFCCFFSLCTPCFCIFLVWSGSHGIPKYLWHWLNCAPMYCDFPTFQSFSWNRGTAIPGSFVQPSHMFFVCSWPTIWIMKYLWYWRFCTPLCSIFRIS